MTTATINTKNTPTAEAIQEALAFLKTLAERKPAADGNETSDSNLFFNPDIFETIEAALKNSAEANASAASIEDDSEDEGENVRQNRHSASAANQDIDEENEEEPEDDDDEEEDNSFADDYYWNPGPEWKTIGLVAGGAALVGLGALLYKLFDD